MSRAIPKARTTKGVLGHILSVLQIALSRSSVLFLEKIMSGSPYSDLQACLPTFCFLPNINKCHHKLRRESCLFTFEHPYRVLLWVSHGVLPEMRIWRAILRAGTCPHREEDTSPEFRVAWKRPWRLGADFRDLATTRSKADHMRFLRKMYLGAITAGGLAALAPAFSSRKSGCQSGLAQKKDHS